MGAGTLPGAVLGARGHIGELGRAQPRHPAEVAQGRRRDRDVEAPPSGGGQQEGAGFGAGTLGRHDRRLDEEALLHQAGGHLQAPRGDIAPGQQLRHAVVDDQRVDRRAAHRRGQGRPGTQCPVGEPVCFGERAGGQHERPGPVRGEGVDRRGGHGPGRGQRHGRQRRRLEDVADDPAAQRDGLREVAETGRPAGQRVDVGIGEGQRDGGRVGGHRPQRGQPALGSRRAGARLRARPLRADQIRAGHRGDRVEQVRVDGQRHRCGGAALGGSGSRRLGRGPGSLQGRGWRHRRGRRVAQGGRVALAGACGLRDGEHPPQPAGRGQRGREGVVELDVLRGAPGGVDEREYHRNRAGPYRLRGEPRQPGRCEPDAHEPLRQQAHRLDVQRVDPQFAQREVGNGGPQVEGGAGARRQVPGDRVGAGAIAPDRRGPLGVGGVQVGPVVDAVTDPQPHPDLPDLLGADVRDGPGDLQQPAGAGGPGRERRDRDAQGQRRARRRARRGVVVPVLPRGRRDGRRRHA